MKCTRLPCRSRDIGCKTDKADRSRSRFLVTYIYEHHSGLGGSPHHTTMSGCTLRFAKDSPLRTTLVDEATGYAKYQIDTPIRLVRSATRIRKFDSPTQPPLHWDDDADSDSGDDITDKRKKKKSKKDENDEGEIEAELPETSDEIARIYWKWFSSDRIIFRGRIHLRTEFLPKCGTLKG